MQLCPLCSPDPCTPLAPLQRWCRSWEPVGAREALFILAFPLSWRSFLMAGWQLIFWVRCDTLLGVLRASADSLTRIVFNLDAEALVIHRPLVGPQAMLTLSVPTTILASNPNWEGKELASTPWRELFTLLEGNYAARSTMDQQVPLKPSVTHLSWGPGVHPHAVHQPGPWDSQRPSTSMLSWGWILPAQGVM